MMHFLTRVTYPKAVYGLKNTTLILQLVDFILGQNKIELLCDFSVRVGEKNPHCTTLGALVTTVSM